LRGARTRLSGGVNGAFAKQTHNFGIIGRKFASFLNLFALFPEMRFFVINHNKSFSYIAFLDL
jgi:hypothetical protein